MIKVLVNGASGRMGSEVVRSIEKEEGLILCGAVDPKCTGQDIGDVVGIGYKGIQIYGSLEEAFVCGKPDVVVDFTSPKVIYSNAQTVLAAGINMVIGTTGLKTEERKSLSAICHKNSSHCLIAPNFSLGAVLMMKVSEEIAKYFPNAEI